ncbi:hypothetical protein PFLUV_G00160480 [Perca fluviatilis]|uniref:UPAR/Ly6 domain-containing protein n=1 Tax=Perca fluviatilis TaxID=8168 RepID=A0A6A5ESC7_PERFL|nr:phospholipase A2 inhibitor and Ly6/PLAUR domain-containing protein-like [Perca fluviatilis]KAF1382058.1 hypothetical protein PFLUV_G00160480 [Perca fluviatilis]
MKLILSLTLLWALSSTAGALQCQTCINQNCSSTVPQPCSSETACIAASIQANVSGFSTQQIFKACAPSSLCPALGPQTFSGNVGFANALVYANCCNTDNCNMNIIPIPVAQTNNSLKCYTCDLFTSNCNSSIQCKGVENSCIQATLTTLSSTFLAFGCASTNLCAAASLGNLTSIESVNATGVSCCGTSLCNTVKTNTTSVPTTAAPTTSEAGCRIRLGMIHLLLGLLVFTLC